MTVSSVVTCLFFPGMIQLWSWDRDVRQSGDIVQEGGSRREACGAGGSSMWYWWVEACVAGGSRQLCMIMMNEQIKIPMA